MNKALNTKERIGTEALELFAKRGYHAVSIRDICKEVGIKESTVYYHYQNKQAIWNALVAKVDGLIKEMTAAFDSAFEGISHVPEEAMCQVAVGILTDYFLHPYVFKTLAMLAIERMADAGADGEYKRMAFDLPLHQQGKVFAQMMERGIIAPGDPQILAAQYHGIIYLAFEKNCVGATPGQEKIGTACEEIRRQIGDLYRKMRRDEP